MMARMKRSLILQREVKTMFYWLNNFYKAAWKRNYLLNDNDENRKVRNEIDTKVWEIRELIKKLYGPEIGKQIISDLE